MKYIKSFIAILLLLFISVGIGVSAMDTGLSTEALSEKDKNTLISNVNITVLTDEPKKEAIKCFDVNENGLIAIGQNNGNRKNLSVYSDDGVFQYGYAFEDEGSFFVEWNGDDINIYFVRGDILITVSRDGQVVDSAKVQNTIENNNYKNHTLYSNERSLGSTRYILKNDLGIFNITASSYSQLVVIGTDGEETIIYDVNSAQFVKVFTVFILIVIFFLIVIIVLARGFKQKQQT